MKVNFPPAHSSPGSGDGGIESKRAWGESRLYSFRRERCRRIGRLCSAGWDGGIHFPAGGHTGYQHQRMPVCGARVELVRGNISDAAKLMNERKKSNPGWFDVSTLKEPYRLEGKKTMGYELAEQMNWQLPTSSSIRAGGGTGLIGMWKAFDEMEQIGWIGSKRPKMVSVQSTGCAPVVRAFNEKKTDSQFWENAETIASGLRVPKAFADHLILDAIYRVRMCCGRER